MGYFLLQNAFLTSLGILQLEDKLRHIEKNELNLSFVGIPYNTKTKMKFPLYRCGRIFLDGFREVRKTYYITIIDLAFFGLITKRSFIC